MCVSPRGFLRGRGAVIVGANIEEAFTGAVMLGDNALRQFRASRIGTPQPRAGAEPALARAQMWHPKVVAKMWNFYVMKGRADGVI